jgi:ribonuclease P protein subunit POP4
MNLKDVLKMEFIGFDIEIVDSKNSSLIGKKGKIIDETKNTFVIQDNDKKVSLLKNQIQFTIKIDNKKLLIDGKLICFRSEERIKKIK